MRRDKSNDMNLMKQNIAGDVAIAEALIRKKYVSDKKREDHKIQKHLPHHPFDYKGLKHKKSEENEKSNFVLI